jgi:hypothetical protein
MECLIVEEKQIRQIQINIKIHNNVLVYANGRRNSRMLARSNRFMSVLAG